MLKIDPHFELVPIANHHVRPLFHIIDHDRHYLRQWQNWPDYIRTLDDVRAIVRRSDEKRATNNGFDLVILYQGEIVGKIGLVYVAWGDSRTEIGYWLAKEYQGKGIMTRACRAVTDYALTEMGLEGVHVRVAVGNMGSRAIPERIGFANTGVLPNKTWLHGQRIQEVLYIMTIEKWRRINAIEESISGNSG